MSKYIYHIANSTSLISGYIKHLEGSSRGQLWHRTCCSGLTTLSTEIPVYKIGIIVCSCFHLYWRLKFLEQGEKNHFFTQWIVYLHSSCTQYPCTPGFLSWFLLYNIFGCSCKVSWVAAQPVSQSSKVSICAGRLKKIAFWSKPSSVVLNCRCNWIC